MLLILRRIIYCYPPGKFSEAALAADKQLALAELSKNKKSEASARYNAGVVAYM